MKLVHREDISPSAFDLQVGEATLRFSLMPDGWWFEEVALDGDRGYCGGENPVNSGQLTDLLNKMADELATEGASTAPEAGR